MLPALVLSGYSAFKSPLRTGQTGVISKFCGGFGDKAVLHPDKRPHSPWAPSLFLMVRAASAPLKHSNKHRNHVCLLRT